MMISRLADMFLDEFVLTTRFRARTSFDKYGIAAVKSADRTGSFLMKVHAEDNELSPETLVIKVSTFDSSVLFPIRAAPLRKSFFDTIQFFFQKKKIFQTS